MFRHITTRFVAALAVALGAATLSTPAWAQRHAGHHGGHGGHHGFGHHYDFGHGFYGHYGYGYGYGHHYSPFYLGLYYGPGYGYGGDYYVGSYGYSPRVVRSYDSPSLYADPRTRQTTGDAGLDLQRQAEASFRSHHYEDAIRSFYHDADYVGQMRRLERHIDKNPNDGGRSDHHAGTLTGRSFHGPRRQERAKGLLRRGRVAVPSAARV